MLLKKSNDSTGVDRSCLVAKTNSIALKTKTDMLDLDTLRNVLTGLRAGAKSEV